VGSTHEPNIRWTAVAAAAKRIVVVELEASTLDTAATLPIYERALTAVSLPHDAPDRSLDVPRRTRRVGLFETLPRRPGFRKPSGLEPLELLGHSGFDDRGQVFVHERLETLELVAQLRTGCERHLVPRRRKGLDDTRRRRR
jgi:hypothetical protein